MTIFAVLVTSIALFGALWAHAGMLHEARVIGWSAYSAAVYTLLGFAILAFAIVWLICVMALLDGMIAHAYLVALSR